MDDTQDFDKILNDKVQAARKLEKLTSLTLATTRALDGVLTAERQDVLAPFLETVEEQQKQCQVELAEAQQARDDCLNLRRIQEDAIEIPRDGAADDATINIKQLKSAVGELRDDNKHHIKFFCHRLKSYGESLDWMHDTYKVALSLLLYGELQEQFIHQNHKTLPEILQWFYDVYHRPDTLIDLEASLASFVRQEKEPIIICMKRYLLTAERADLHLPVNMKYYSTDRHLTKILISLVLEPAKTSLNNFVTYQLQVGVPVKYSDVLSEADRREKRFRCIPTTQISLVDADVSLVPASISTVSVPQTQAPSTVDTSEECHSAVRRDKISRPSPYSIRKSPSSPARVQQPVDPIKHTGNRPSMYNSRTNNERTTRRQAPPSGRSSGFVQKPFLSAQKPQSRKFNSSRRQLPYRNNGEYPPNEFTSRRVHYQNIPFYNRYYPQNKLQTSSSSSSPWNPRSQNNSYSISSSPPRHNNQRSNQRSFPPSPRGPFRMRHKPVRQNLFCARCGKATDADTDTWANSDHTTYECPVYTHHNPHGCSTCKGMGISAKHYTHECKQRKD